MTHAASRRVALVCCSRLCMNLHWLSVKGRPVRLMLSSISWASSNSHCTTKTGPASQKRSKFRTQRFRLPVLMPSNASYSSTRGRSLARRNTSTPLQDVHVRTSLAERCASTCTGAKRHKCTSTLFGPQRLYHSFAPVASLGSLDGRTAGGVPAVGWFVRFPHWEPGGVGQTSYLHPSMSLRQQLLCHSVNIQHDAQTARTGDRVTAT